MTTKGDVALVTCKVLPEPDPDQQPLLDALRSAGLSAALLPWDDPASDPGAHRVCVLRSCWNYYADPPAFLAWIAGAARRSRLVNPEGVVRWNLHKRYLKTLDVPTIPTAWLPRGAPADLAATMAERGWDDVIVKPAVSAASYRTRRFRADETGRGQAFLAELVADRDAMVQRTMPSVETTGERALVWIDGELTHAVRKHPRLEGADERVSDALPVTGAERELAARALSAVAGELMYARVDVVEDDDGSPLVSEVELMEPSLFLVQHPAAMARLVGAIARILGDE